MREKTNRFSRLRDLNAHFDFIDAKSLLITKRSCRSWYC